MEWSWEACGLSSMFFYLTNKIFYKLHFFLLPLINNHFNKEIVRNAIFGLIFLYPSSEKCHKKMSTTPFFSDLVIKDLPEHRWRSRPLLLSSLRHEHFAARWCWPSLVFPHSFVTFGRCSDPEPAQTTRRNKMVLSRHSVVLFTKWRLSSWEHNLDIMV